MQTRVGDLSAAWRRRGVAQGIRVRVGIDTGYCTVGVFGSELLECYTAQGVTVNTAARLQTTAAPGEVLCSFATQALLEDRIQTAPRGALTLRGIARPVETFALEGATR